MPRRRNDKELRLRLAYSVVQPIRSNLRSCPTCKELGAVYEDFATPGTPAAKRARLKAEKRIALRNALSAKKGET